MMLEIERMKNMNSFFFFFLIKITCKNEEKGKILLMTAELKC